MVGLYDVNSRSEVIQERLSVHCLLDNFERLLHLL